MNGQDTIFALHSTLRDQMREVEMSLSEYLEACRDDPQCYASPAERMLRAIGEPEMVDTSRDPRLSRLFLNRTVRMYPAFAEFTAWRRRSSASSASSATPRRGSRNAAGALPARPGGRRQVLPGRAAQALMEKEPIYVLKAGDQLSPIFREPARAVRPRDHGRCPPGALQHSAPGADRHREPLGAEAAGGMGRRPGALPRRQAVPVAAQADRRRQDRTRRRQQPGHLGLVGKVDIRKLETYSQNDPDAYGFSGGLNRANQGIPRIRRDVQGADQDAAPAADRHAGRQLSRHGEHRRNPVPGHPARHSKRGGVQTFRNNPHNEAFLDRVSVVKVPYCLRVTEESRIYEKLISGSALAEAPCAPHTLEMLARFAVLSRPQAPRELSPVRQDAGVRRREISARPTPR